MRTGSSSDGFYGGPLLEKLVPLAHRYGIAVIAWDFPTLSDPARDAARAADAFGFGVDAFSPDMGPRPRRGPCSHEPSIRRRPSTIGGLVSDADARVSLAIGATWIA